MIAINEFYQLGYGYENVSSDLYKDHYDDYLKVDSYDKLKNGNNITDYQK